MRKKLITLLGLAAAVGASASPVRSDVGGDGSAYIGDAEVTAADYIQDGLIACWDGIENMGYGEHDPTATKWIDLVGEYNLDLPTRDHTWEADCIRCDSTKPMYAERSQAFFDATKDGYTVEAVMNVPILPNTTGGSSCNVIGWGGGYSRIFGTYETTNYGGRILLFSTWSNSYGGVGITRPQGSTYSLDGDVDKLFEKKAYFALVGDVLNQQTTRYDNARIRSWPDAAVLGIDNTKYKWVAINGNGQNHDGYGAGIGNGVKFYCVRIYGRPLTELEIEYNHMVDRIRFGVE